MNPCSAPVWRYMLQSVLLEVSALTGEERPTIHAVSIAELKNVCVWEMAVLSVLFSKHILHLTLDYCLKKYSDILTHRSCIWRRQSCNNFCFKNVCTVDFWSFFFFFHTAYNCPSGLVYKPCGPINPATCDPRYGKTKRLFKVVLDGFFPYFYLSTFLRKFSYFIMKCLVTLDIFSKI